MQVVLAHPPTSATTTATAITCRLGHVVLPLLQAKTQDRLICSEVQPLAPRRRHVQMPASHHKHATACLVPQRVVHQLPQTYAVHANSHPPLTSKRMLLQGHATTAICRDEVQDRSNKKFCHNRFHANFQTNISMQKSRTLNRVWTSCRAC